MPFCVGVMRRGVVVGRGVTIKEGENFGERIYEVACRIVCFDIPYPEAYGRRHRPKRLLQLFLEALLHRNRSPLLVKGAVMARQLGSGRLRVWVMVYPEEG